MIFSRKHSANAAARPLIQGVVALRGDLTYLRAGTLAGRIEGTVQGEAALILSAEADLRGTLRTGDLQVQGRVKGGIIARGGVTLASGCEVTGPLQGESLVLEQGAHYQGAVSIRPPL
jgi:cytoskeletal protein CcmA (bactofilin family)